MSQFNCVTHKQNGTDRHKAVRAVRFKFSSQIASLTFLIKIIIQFVEFIEFVKFVEFIEVMSL